MVVVIAVLVNVEYVLETVITILNAKLALHALKETQVIQVQMGVLVLHLEGMITVLVKILFLAKNLSPH
jgi:hypothetical protein